MNFFTTIFEHPEQYRQYRCGDSLITMYDCPLKNRFVDLWSKHNYFVYVLEGRKIWHTAQGSYDLQKGSSVFVRKGASIVEQFFDTPFCLIVFFVSDEFICDTLKFKAARLPKPAEKKFEPVMVVERNEMLEAFFHSMASYFGAAREPDQILLELKFRELVLTVAESKSNAELLAYFCSLLHEPQAVSLRRVMDDNYRFNLKQEAYAELSNRSLSAFKRDFQKIFKTTPGKWLLEKRLDHAMHLLRHAGKTVSEAAFESGFENTSHFSRSFKKRFGQSPNAVKTLQTS